VHAGAAARPTLLARPAGPVYVPTMNPEVVVRDFCNAVGRRDPKALLAFFAEGAVYHNIPMEPATGLAAIGALLEQFLGPTSELEFDVLALAVNGNTVLTERVDRMVMNGKRVAIPVMGAFEVTADGKISAWRDYFDMQMFMSQLQ
jgi:limonene-1,2-epoxide hydrolase